MRRPPNHDGRNFSPILPKTSSKVHLFGCDISSLQSSLGVLLLTLREHKDFFSPTKKSLESIINQLHLPTWTFPTYQLSYRIPKRQLPPARIKMIRRAVMPTIARLIDNSTSAMPKIRSRLRRPLGDTLFHQNPQGPSHPAGSRMTAGENVHRQLLREQQAY